MMTFTLTNGTTLDGVVRWYDDDAVCIASENRDEVTVYKHAIVSFQSKP